MSALLRPTDLKEISAEAEAAKMEEEREFKRKKERRTAELREAFMARDVLQRADPGQFANVIDRANAWLLSAQPRSVLDSAESEMGKPNFCF